MSFSVLIVIGTIGRNKPEFNKALHRIADKSGSRKKMLGVKAKLYTLQEANKVSEFRLDYWIPKEKRSPNTPADGY